MCDIMIYTEMYVFALCPIPGIGLLKPLKFPES